jgi:uncharacterized protein YdhG (YjbR/CyaY superfamily)
MPRIPRGESPPIARDSVTIVGTEREEHGTSGTITAAAMPALTIHHYRVGSNSTCRRLTMAKTDFKSVDEYVPSQPEAVQGILGRVPSAIRKAVPGAEEVISYRIRTYKLHSGLVLYFAGWKQHYYLYPATERVVAGFKDELAPYEVTKGTIRFPLSQPVPVKLIGRIAKFPAKEAAEHAKARAPRRRRAK